MYSRILIPLDGSKIAEKVLPYARTLAGSLRIPVELIAVIDISEMATSVSADKHRLLDSMIEEGVRSTKAYLEGVARTFHDVSVRSTVEKGRPAEVIIEKASEDKDLLIALATHGRSGIKRWLLGSVAEKVLRGARTPLFLVRAGEEGSAEGEGSLKRVVVPLDGSELAESILPMVVQLAKALKLEVLLIRVFGIPAGMYSGGEGYYVVDYESVRKQFEDEAREYIENKTGELRRQGIDQVSFVLPEGFGPDEIIACGRKTPDSFIAMCTHGRSGVTRWVLGSVAETVVRHSGNPVLVVRPS
jgi:nucleotide-binding universal stress UspA family protein